MQSNQNPIRPQDDPQPVHNGVPLSEATARDFIQVRAALVHRLGNADDALVWTRIYWRTESEHRGTYDFEGRAWWAPARDQLANETGLKESQVRRALERLEKGGFLLGVQHRRGGPYDRQKSYSCVVAEMAELPLPSAAGAISEKAELPDVERANLPDVPSTETTSRGETTTLLDGLIEAPAQQVGEDFEVKGVDVIWQAWPTPAGRSRNESKAAARKAFVKALGKVRFPARAERLDMIVGAACAWAQAAARRIEAGQFQPVPYLATWLNQERWTDDVPQLDPTTPAGFDVDGPAARAARTLAIGQQLEAQQDQAQFDLAHSTEQRRMELGR